MNAILADGLRRNVAVHKTKVYINFDGRFIRTVLFVLPFDKHNQILIGTNFLSNAGIISDVANQLWYFIISSKKKFKFEEDSFRALNEAEKKPATINVSHLIEND